MNRQIIEIDEDKCNGCGECVPECHEGALQIIDGKARLVSDLFCDGLGACIGYCPQGAIEIVEREAVPYDEIKVLERMIKQPESVLKAHLKHLSDHSAYEFLEIAVSYLSANGINNPINECNDLSQNNTDNLCGCPGSRMIQFEEINNKMENNCMTDIPSELKQWPVQLHLVNPSAPYFKDSELVIMSTCGPIANANVHRDYFKGRSIVVACPKLDYTAPYTDKLAEIFTTGNIKKAIVVIMQVPCCSGLMKFALEAKEQAKRYDMPIEEHILALDGKLINIINA